MFQYVKGLRFEETPDCNNLHKLLAKVAKNNKFIIDGNLPLIKEEVISEKRIDEVTNKSNKNELKSSNTKGDKSEYINN